MRAKKDIASRTSPNSKSDAMSGLMPHYETIDTAAMKIKYMEIAIDNGLYGAEYYRSYPNIETLKDGEADRFEGYRYWHSAFSPEDNHFNLKTEQNLLPFVRTYICVKSYAEYDIRVTVAKNFN